MPKTKCKKGYTSKQICVKKRSKKVIIPISKKHELGKYGYKNVKSLGVRKRRQALTKAVKKYKAKKVLSKLGAIRTLHKNKDKDLSLKYLNNMVWLRKKFDKDFKGSYKKSTLYKK